MVPPLAGRQATMVFTDLLYNVPIDENVCGNSATDSAHTD